MRYLAQISLTFVTFLVMTGCVEWLNNTQYRLVCIVDKELGVDSVSLMLLEDSYNRVYHLATEGLDSASGAFVFEGQIETPGVAFLKFDNDSTSFFFVLEHGETNVTIGSRGVVVKGGEINHEYITYLNQRNSIISEQKAIWQNYMSLTANDSLVNIEQEQKLARQDSVLSDSLERITIEAINRGTPASRIIYDRYVSSLRHNYLRKINIH